MRKATAVLAGFMLACGSDRQTPLEPAIGARSTNQAETPAPASWRLVLTASGGLDLSAFPSEGSGHVVLDTQRYLRGHDTLTTVTWSQCYGSPDPGCARVGVFPQPPIVDTIPSSAFVGDTLKARLTITNVDVTWTRHPSVSCQAGGVDCFVFHGATVQGTVFGWLASAAGPEDAFLGAGSKAGKRCVLGHTCPPTE